MEVSKRFWINLDTVLASEIGSVCSGLKPSVSVALFLIREKKLGDESSWKPHIDILAKFTNSTIFWYVFGSFDFFFGFWVRFSFSHFWLF